MSFQYFKNDFRYAAAAPVIYNSCIILFGWIYSSSPESTVYGFAIGGLIGSILGHFLIQIIGAKKNGLSFKLLKPKGEHILQYMTISLPLIVGQSIAVVDEQLFRYFGSFLTTGSIASFRYARRVALIPVGIYQRGLFTGEDTLRVSKIFLIVSFGLIPWSINQIVTRSYYVQRNYWFPVWVGTSITLVTVILLKLNSAPTLDFLKIFLVGTAVYFLTTAINIYSGNLIFEVIIDSLFILILIFLSLFLVKMKYVNLKRIR